jgi:sec-independent protein translocase protein TatB
MFDIGFWELVLCAVVALLVLGPERMPVAVRSVAHWVRAARATLNAVKAEFEHELELDTLKQEFRGEEQTPNIAHPASSSMPSPQTTMTSDIQNAIAELKAAASRRIDELGVQTDASTNSQAPDIAAPGTKDSPHATDSDHQS